MITAGERVAKVLARDERLVEVFAAASPAFERLRSPAMRRTMARLVSVEQAARMAGVDAVVLVERLNAALAERAPRAGAPAASAAAINDDPGISAEDAMTGDSPPILDVAAVLAAVPPERVVEVDVREDLRNGQEPFSRIMAARQTIPEDGVMKLRAIFEPIPLYRVLAKQGLEYWTNKLAEDDWVVWFYPAAMLEDRRPSVVGHRSTATNPGPTTDDRQPTADDDPSVIVLDVRGMEPPEPMVRTLAALEQLPTGATLLQLNVRVPRFLLPKLGELGFTYEVREQSDELVRIFIRRRDG